MPRTVVAHLLDRPDVVWDNFAAQVGAPQLKACYGWTVPPRAARPSETVWSYRDGAQLVGWGSLVKDPTTAVYWHASGIFPVFQGQGYRQAIRQHLCREAFARGAQAVTLVVLDTNQAHLARCYREAEAGSPWQPSGRIWRPAPGQTLFTLLREDAPLVTGMRAECAELHGITQGGPHGT